MKGEWEGNSVICLVGRRCMYIRSYPLSKEVADGKRQECQALYRLSDAR